MSSRTQKIVRRLLMAVPQLLLLTLIIFGVLRAAPGEPVLRDLEGTFSVPREEVRRMLGLDKPFHVQYITWMQDVFLHGDLGESFFTKQPVTEMMLVRLGPTVLLTLTALVISTVLGMLIGFLGARYRNSVVDSLVTLFSFIGVSVPSFWVALVLILVFAVTLRWVPVAGMKSVGEPHEGTVLDILHHLILPVTALAVAELTAIARYMRASMIEVLSEDYIRVARAKGLSDKFVIWRHAFRNALMPIITLMGLRLPGLFGGSALIEFISAWPGMGRMAVQAATYRDYPVTQGFALVIAAIVVGATLLTDIVYGIVDPRIEEGV